MPARLQLRACGGLRDVRLRPRPAESSAVSVAGGDLGARRRAVTRPGPTGRRTRLSVCPGGRAGGAGVRKRDLRRRCLRRVVHRGRAHRTSRERGLPALRLLPAVSVAAPLDGHRPTTRGMSAGTATRATATRALGVGTVAGNAEQQYGTEPCQVDDRATTNRIADRRAPSEAHQCDHCKKCPDLKSGTTNRGTCSAWTRTR